MRRLVLVMMLIGAVYGKAQNVNGLRNGSWRPAKAVYKWNCSDSICMKRPAYDSLGDLNFTIRGNVQEFHTGRTSGIIGGKVVLHKTESWDIIGHYTFGNSFTITFDDKLFVLDLIRQTPTHMIVKVKKVLRLK